MQHGDGSTVAHPYKRAWNATVEPSPRCTPRCTRVAAYWSAKNIFVHINFICGILLGKANALQIERVGYFMLTVTPAAVEEFKTFLSQSGKENCYIRLLINGMG